MNRVLFFLLILFQINLVSCQPAPNNLDTKLRTALLSERLKNTWVGLSVYNLKTKQTLCEINSDKLMAPASTLKLIPTGLALNTFGGDYTFDTKVYFKGEVKNNAVENGVLIIKGAGDPALAADRLRGYYPKELFKQVADSLLSMGIKSFSGRIIADISVFEQMTTPGKWLWEDIGNYYGATPSGLSVYENILKLKFTTGAEGSKAILSETIPTTELQLDIQLFAANTGTDNGWFYGDPQTQARTVRGTIPSNRTEFVLKASLPNPEKVVSNMLISSLVNNGIACKVTTEIWQTEIDVSECRLLSTIKSAPLNKIAQAANYRSVNLYADHLFLQLGKQKYGVGSFDTGAKVVYNYFKDKNLPFEGLQLYDGSGLAAFNSISSNQLTSFLTAMYAEPGFQEYLATIPLAGDTAGTMRRFDNKVLRFAELHAKSGSMTGVLTYSGYIYNTKNEMLAFSLFFNKSNISANELRNIANEVFIQLAESN